MNQYDKYDLIEQIILELKGTTGINFQNKIREILVKYYKKESKFYDMPRHYGGDKKNDGWVKEDDLYYQIYAPVQVKENSTLKKEIVKKFEEDLSKLLKILYKDGLWSKKIKEYVFLVNTIDTPLPEDSSGEYEKIVLKLQKDYQINFKFKVVNIDYIRELLETMEIEDLRSIASHLRVRHLLNSDICSAQDVYNAICAISEKISEQFFEEKKVDYKRISGKNKIPLNKLDKRKEKIEKMISKLYIVEEAIHLINDDIEDVDKFEKVKDYIVNQYEELKKSYSGEELYDKIIINGFKFIRCSGNFRNPIELLIVYIFDKCDIFEKEESEVK